MAGSPRHTSVWPARMILKMGLRNSWRARRLLFLAASFLPCCLAQTSVLSVTPPEKVVVKRGASLEVKTAMTLKPGYHVNSNTPTDSYMIPLRLTWEPGALEAVEVVFPKPHTEKSSFSPTPLSVFTGDFALVTKFKVSASAINGPGIAVGKLRYQACNSDSCLQPKTIEIK